MSSNEILKQNKTLFAKIICSVEAGNKQLLYYVCANVRKKSKWFGEPEWNISSLVMIILGTFRSNQQYNSGVCEWGWWAASYWGDKGLHKPLVDPSSGGLQCIRPSPGMDTTTTTTDDYCLKGNVTYFTINYLHGRFLYKPGIRSWIMSTSHWMTSTLSGTDFVMSLLLTWTATLNMVNLENKKKTSQERDT